MSDEVIMVKIEHESHVTWERAFGGHPTKLRLCQYRTWTEAFLEGDHGDKVLIGGVSIEVLRRIVAIADALPAPSPGAKR